MKTRKQWFKTLPEHISKWAIENCKSEIGLHNLCDKKPCLRSSVLGGFKFGSTIEGYVFWNRVADGELNQIMQEHENEIKELDELLRLYLIEKAEEERQQSIRQLTFICGR